MPTEAQIRSMDNFKKRNPTYWRDKMRDINKKKKEEFELLKAENEDLKKKI